MAKHINNILEFISSWGNSEFSSSLLSEVLSPEDIVNKAKDEKDEKKRTSLYTMAKSRKERVEAIQGKVTKIETDLEDPKWRGRGENGKFLPNQKMVKVAHKERAERGKDILSRAGNDPKRIQKRRLDIDIENLDPEKESRRQGIYQKKIGRFTSRTDETSSSKKSDKPREVPSTGAPADKADVPSIAAPVPPPKKPSRWSIIRSTLANGIEDIKDISVAAPLIRIGTGVLRGAAAATKPYTGKTGPSVSFPALQNFATDSILLGQALKTKRDLRNTTDKDEMRRLRARLRQLRFGGVLGGGTFGGGNNS